MTYCCIAGENAGAAKVAAISDHHGQSCHGGHWTTRVNLEANCGGGGGDDENRWLIFNDRLVSVKMVAPNHRQGMGKTKGKNKGVGEARSEGSLLLPASSSASLAAYVATKPTTSTSSGRGGSKA